MICNYVSSSQKKNMFRYSGKFRSTCSIIFCNKQISRICWSCRYIQFRNAFRAKKKKKKKKHPKAKIGWVTSRMNYWWLVELPMCLTDDFSVTFWWLVRVTLVVDWWLLPQNFGPVVGTYEGLLQLCEWTLGGDSSSRWWGKTYTVSDHRTFYRHRWWRP